MLPSAYLNAKSNKGKRELHLNWLASVTSVQVFMVPCQAQTAIEIFYVIVISNRFDMA